MEKTNPNGKKEQEFYEALLRKDPQYLGVFFVGVKTTGIFCAPTCRARKPKYGNTEYFSTVQQALLQGYRPCKICNPTVVSFDTPDYVLRALDELKIQPKQKLKDYQLRNMGITPEVLRRWFLKNYGMTFHAYQRMVRINMAMQELQSGKPVLEAAMDSGFESLSGFGYAYKQALGKTPTQPLDSDPLVLKRFPTPLGPMFVGASAKGVCLLEFVDRRMLETEMKDLHRYFKAPIVAGENQHTIQAEQELKEYFAGTRTGFTVPLDSPGTEFQKRVWNALRTIPFGTMVSYEHIASMVGSQKGVRAVGTANGMNRIAIFVPCHRVIRKNGHLGGYGGGLERKKWLLDFEQGMSRQKQG